MSAADQSLLTEESRIELDSWIAKYPPSTKSRP